MPYISAHGLAEVSDPPPFWLVLGNTCDFDRPLREVAFTQLAPIWNLAEEEPVPAQGLAALSQYTIFTRFYLSPWESAVSNMTLISREGWLLFHACLVRFLARDDGRND